MTRSDSIVGKVSIAADAGLRASVRRSCRTYMLGAERTTAAACGFHLRVAELEAGAFQALHIVNLGAVQIQHARLIDEHLQITELVGLVEYIWCGFEGHRVAKARTSAAHHGNAQTCGPGLLHAQNLIHFANGSFGKLNHPKSLLAYSLNHLE